MPAGLMLSHDPDPIPASPRTVLFGKRSRIGSGCRAYLIRHWHIPRISTNVLISGVGSGRKTSKPAPLRQIYTPGTLQRDPVSPTRQHAFCCMFRTGRPMPEHHHPQIQVGADDTRQKEPGNNVSHARPCSAPARLILQLNITPHLAALQGTSFDKSYTQSARSSPLLCIYKTPLVVARTMNQAHGLSNFQGRT